MPFEYMKSEIAWFQLCIVGEGEISVLRNGWMYA